MKKNVSGQRCGVQMVSATDGSAFTGSVTVAVTLDAGTQATGSVGSGACTHEGNGYHTYAPSQAETNGDLAAFTFTGTGAVPATVQIYTSFPQTGDSFALIGATGSGLTSLASQSSVNTIDDFLDTEIAAIKAKTDQLTFTTANKVDSTIQAAADLAQAAADKVWSTAARVLTAGTNIALAKGTGVTGFTDLSAAQVNAEVATAISDAALATASALATVDSNVDAVLVDTGTTLPATLATLSTFDPATDPVAVVSLVNALAADSIDLTAIAASGASEIATAVGALVVEGSVTVKQSLQLSNAAAASKINGAATTTVNVRDLADSKNRIVATVDADGNRSAVTKSFD